MLRSRPFVSQLVSVLLAATPPALSVLSACDRTRRLSHRRSLLGISRGVERMIAPQSPSLQVFDLIEPMLAMRTRCAVFEVASQFKSEVHR